MTVFLGQARRQATDLLRYAALDGEAWLVEAASGEVRLAVGGKERPPAAIQARCAEVELGTSVRFMDETTLVGSVGAGHLLVVAVGDALLQHNALRPRVERSCRLLEEMLRGSAMFSLLD